MPKALKGVARSACPVAWPDVHPRSTHYGRTRKQANQLASRLRCQRGWTREILAARLQLIAFLTEDLSNHWRNQECPYNQAGDVA